MAGKFEIYQDKAGKHRLRLKASTGQVVAVGEAYDSPLMARKGCESIQRAAEGATIVVCGDDDPRGPHLSYEQVERAAKNLIKNSWTWLADETVDEEVGVGRRRLVRAFADELGLRIEDTDR